MKKFFLLVFLSSFFLLSFAQTSSSSADIYLGLKKLNVLGRVLYIGAHPDDENTRLLAFLSKDRLYRTGYLSLTRGDGGQNLIGDEQGIALGLIRTQELLAARRVDGAEQFFSRAFDFGFSKGPDETFQHWDKEKILSDVVWVIRNFQPDVIITRFPTTGEGGHGQHTASAILANEAFTAAADPNRFPEQLKFVKPWQAKRILWNTFSFGRINTTSSDQFHFDVGGYNPVLGKSYGEIAALSRSQHKSQGFGSAGSRGEAMEYFKTTGGSAPVNSLFDGVNMTWNRIEGGQKIQNIIDSTIAGFDFDAPQKSLPALIKLDREISGVSDPYWRELKRKEVESLIEKASGLWLECYTNENYVAQGDSLKVNFSINDRLGVGAKLERIQIETFDTSMNVSLSPDRNLNFSEIIKPSPSMPVSQPYWLQKPMEEGYYNVSSQLLRGRPDVEPPFKAVFYFIIDGLPIYFEKVVKYKYVDQVRGEQNQPVVVVPRATVYTKPELILLKKSDDEKKSFTIQVAANTDINYKKEQVYAEIGNSQIISLSDSSGRIAKNTVQQFQVTIDPKSITKIEKVIPSVRFDSSSLNYMALASIKYEHIPFINYFYTDWIKLIPIDLRIYNKKIGYIVGAGDKVPEALEEMGYDVTLLGEKDLAQDNLQQFDAIITGVRAFNTNDWMSKYYDKLMTYVQNGGNYIVQYSQANNLRAGKMGPYNFVVSGKRVTDENAKVTFLQPDHPVLNFPNKITQDDFKDWIQERSIYHASNLDPNFQTIFRMNDPGEAPDDGALVIAKYGKGYFTYTGLVFFRELPAGVPGAYRLLANIIALNRKKEF
jgi:LmbE family N-acetylglucosaminyl deacetylase